MALEYPNYGPADHVRFEDYPERIQIVVGDFLEQESGKFASGQPIVLFKTPKSGVAQGSYVVDEPLPDKRVVFTDTGKDDTFNLKITHYGWGEFYIADPASDEFLSLKMTKGMTVEAGDWDEEKLFESYWYGTTQIPVTEDLKTELGYPKGLEEHEIEIEDIIQDVIDQMPADQVADVDAKDVADELMAQENNYKMVYSPMAINQNVMRDIRRQAEDAVESVVITQNMVAGKDEKEREKYFNEIYNSVSEEDRGSWGGQKYVKGIKVKAGYSIAFDSGY